MAKRLQDKGRRQFILILLGLWVVFSIHPLSAQFAGGSGTADEPYLIATAEDLYNIRYYQISHSR